MASYRLSEILVSAHDAFLLPLNSTRLLMLRVQMEEQGLTALLELGCGDMRRVLNTLQVGTEQTCVPARGIPNTERVTLYFM